MFSKLRKKTATTLAAPLNTIKTAGVDLTHELQFSPAVVLTLINQPLDGMGYDPVQGLLAVSTENVVHVMGQSSHVEFKGPAPAPIFTIKFIKGVYLVGVDADETVLVWSLVRGVLLGVFRAPARICSVETDPGADWILLGLATGVVVTLDVSRMALGRWRLTGVTTSSSAPEDRYNVNILKWNPRDLGSLIVGVGGDVALYAVSGAAAATRPERTLAYGAGATACIYHPNTLHLVAICATSYTFYDAATGVEILTRTHPEPIIKAYWTDAADSTLLLLGATSIAIIPFGAAPLYSLTSYAKMAAHFAAPARTLALRPSVDMLPLARASPYLDAASDPAAVLILHDDGGVSLLDTRTWEVEPTGARLPRALAPAVAPVTCVAAVDVERSVYLNMMAMAAHPNGLVHGGATPLRQGVVTLMLTGDARGVVHAHDAHNDSQVVETRLGDVVGEPSAVTHLSFARGPAELTAAVAGGFVIAKFGRNVRYAKEHPWGAVPAGRLHVLPNTFCNLAPRAPNVKAGLIPLFYYPREGTVTALCHSDAGFIAIGYASGDVVVVDRRGPAVVFDHAFGSAVTALSVSIMDGYADGYSSVLCHVGTAAGAVAVVSLAPDSRGRYAGQVRRPLVESGPAVVAVAVVDAATGEDLAATEGGVARLAMGLLIRGMVVVTSVMGVRVFIDGKVTLKGLKGVVVAGVVGAPAVSQGGSVSPQGAALAVVLSNEIRVVSLPALRDLGVSVAGANSAAAVTRSAVVVRDGIGTRAVAVNHRAAPTPSSLFDPALVLPVRPTAGVMARSMTMPQLDLIMGGPGRKKGTAVEVALGDRALCGAELEVMQAGAYERKNPYVASASRGLNEIFRGVQLGLDGVNERLNAASEFANSKVEEANNAVVKGAFKSKFGA